MADEDIKSMDGSLKSLSQTTGMASVEFTGFTKRLIKMSDSTNNAGKAWTTFSRLVSGTPLWSLQNKFRGIIEIFAGFERRSQENTAAYNEELKATLDRTRAYNELADSFTDLQIEFNQYNADTISGVENVTKLSDATKELLEGTLEFQKANAAGRDDLFAYGEAMKSLSDKFKVASDAQNKVKEGLKASFVFGEKGTVKEANALAREQRAKTGIKANLAKSPLSKTILGISKIRSPIKSLVKTTKKTAKMRAKYQYTVGKFLVKASMLVNHLLRMVAFAFIISSLIILVAVPIIKKIFDWFQNEGRLQALKKIGGKIMDIAMSIFRFIFAFISGDYQLAFDYGIAALHKIKDFVLEEGYNALIGLRTFLSEKGPEFLAKAVGKVEAFFRKLVQDKEFRDTLLGALITFLGLYMIAITVKMFIGIAAHIAAMYLIPAMIIGGVAILIATGVTLLLAGIIEMVKNIDFFASGGVSSGGLAIVGERGPELVNLPAGSRVHSNANSRKMVGGGQSVVNNFNVTINAKDTSDAEMRRIADELGKHFAKNVTRSFQSGLLR